MAFFSNSLPVARASDVVLPAAGTMVHLSPAFHPSVLKGIKVNRQNPLKLDFILDAGDPKSAIQKPEISKLIKYFLASLTIPENDLWVNLSPYEHNRIITPSFGQTEMGRDLLAEDYLLKQITSSLLYPDDPVGQKFWKRIYKEAADKFHTTHIPVNTFNKVWIIPDKAVIYENPQTGTAYIVQSKLKVLMEQDYLAKKVVPDTTFSPVMREVVIPELTREVNDGENFAVLRQVYNSLILATWYKKKIKDSILSQVYADKNKVSQLESKTAIDPNVVYQKYVQSFQKGAYNLVRQEQDPVTLKLVPRKYFSGGFSLAIKDQMMSVTNDLPKEHNKDYRVSIDLAMIQDEDVDRKFKDLLLDLASAKDTTRQLAASSIAMLSKNPVFIQKDLIENFINPQGIKQSLIETAHYLKAGETLSIKQARRNTRHATLFSISRLYMARPEREKLWNYLRDQLNDEAQQWLVHQHLSVESKEIREGTSEERKIIRMYQLGQRDFNDKEFSFDQEEGIGRPLTFFENLRLYALAKRLNPQLLTSKTGAQWPRIALENIYPDKFKDDLAWQLIFKPYKDQSMKVEKTNPLLPLSSYNGDFYQFLKNMLDKRYSQWGLPKGLGTQILSLLKSQSKNPTLARQKLYEQVIRFEFDPRWEKGYSIYKDQIKYKSSVEQIRDFLKRLNPKAHILDFGAGNNAFGNSILKEFPEMDVTGVDRMDYHEQTRLPNLHYIKQISATQLPSEIEDHSIDLITLNAVGHHLDDEILPLIFAEFKRVLKPEGRIILIEDTYSMSLPVFGRSSDSDLTYQFLKLIEKHGPGFARDFFTFIDWYSNIIVHEWDGMAMPYKFRSMEEWKALMETQGLKQTYAEHLGFPQNGFHKPDLGVMEFRFDQSQLSKDALTKIADQIVQEMLQKSFSYEHWQNFVKHAEDTVIQDPDLNDIYHMMRFAIKDHSGGIDLKRQDYKDIFEEVQNRLSILPMSAFDYKALPREMQTKVVARLFNSFINHDLMEQYLKDLIGKYGLQKVMEKTFALFKLLNNTYDKLQMEGSSFKRQDIYDQGQYNAVNLSKAVEELILKDQSMTIQKNGGIDLTAQQLPLETRTSDGTIVFKTDTPLLARLQSAVGFSPIIVNIEPLFDLRGFLTN